MNDHEPTPLPAEADLARINDALDARIDGRAARVPGTLAADPQWVDAVHTVRDSLHRTAPDAVLAPHRDTAVAAALAVFDAEFVRPVAADVAAGAPAAIEHVAPIGTDPPLAPVIDPTTHAAEGDRHLATVLRPSRWRRAGLVMSAAAAVLLVGAVISTRGSSDDRASTGGMAAEIATDQNLAVPADATVAGDATSKSIDNAPPGNTIGAIEGAAVAAPVIDTADELLALARTYEADLAVTDGTMAPDDVSVASEARAMAVYDCPLTADQVALAEVQWQGALGVAVYDTVTGVVTVIDPTCAVLTSVTP